MKRYSSVFEMIVRVSIYKVLGVLGLMVVAEAILLAMDWNSLQIVAFTMEDWVDRSLICIPFLVAYCLITKVLSSAGANEGSMQGYTLQRLRIPEKRVYVLQCVYNILCYGMLWMIQVMILFGAAFIYMKQQSEVIVTNQTIFLAFYRNTFMHSVLPMEDIFGWWTLGFFILVTGCMTAKFARSQRRGKVNWSLLIFLAIAAICFQRDLTTDPTYMILLMVCLAIVFIDFIFCR